MKRFAKLLLVTLGFGALGFVMSLVPQKNATGASGAPVSIVSSIPLSVTGTVGVNNFPATLTGASVPVSGTVNANVTFPSSLTVTLPTHLGVTPANLVTLICNGFSLGGTCTSFSTVKTDTTLQIFSLSAGTGLVITDIELAAGGINAGQLGGVFIRATCSGAMIYNAFALADQGGAIFLADHITGGLHFTTLPCFEVAESTEAVTSLTLIGYLVQE